MTAARTSPLESAAGDDLVLPFETVASGVKGRIVRLGSVAETVLGRHGYPEPVSMAVGHALALAAMLGAPLAAGARLGLQTRTDGPLGFLFVDYAGEGRIRATASFSKERLSALTPAGGRLNEGALLGAGNLALTLDPGSGDEISQGIVGLEGESIAAAANTYFRQREELPAYIRLAVARHRVASERRPGAESPWTWRAAGLLVQHPGHAGEATGAGEEGLLSEDEAEDWQRVRLLAATVEDHELLDPSLSADELLLRLFHEEGVRVFPPRHLSAECRCSRERVAAFLKSFSAEDLAGMSEEDGSHVVTCEFCSATYRFSKDEIG